MFLEFSGWWDLKYIESIQHTCTHTYTQWPNTHTHTHTQWPNTHTLTHTMTQGKTTDKYDAISNIKDLSGKKKHPHKNTQDTLLEKEKRRKRKRKKRKREPIPARNWKRPAAPQMLSCHHYINQKQHSRNDYKLSEESKRLETCLKAK